MEAGGGWSNSTSLFGLLGVGEAGDTAVGKSISLFKVVTSNAYARLTFSKVVFAYTIFRVEEGTKDVSPIG